MAAAGKAVSKPAQAIMCVIWFFNYFSFNLQRASTTRGK
jgi:hypothetical protein